MRGERACAGGMAGAVALALLAPAACRPEPEDPAVVTTPIEVDAAGGTPDAKVRRDTAPPDVLVPPPPVDGPQADVAVAPPDMSLAEALPPPADAAPVDTLTGLSDDFCSNELDASWNVLNASKFDLTVRDGALHLVPNQSLLWFNNSTGAFVWKPVTGDFKVTSTVRPRKRSDFGQPATDKIHLGGLMARSPADGRENYVFIVVGVDVNDHSIETKTTVDGSSTYMGPVWTPWDAELRLCRLGSTFRLYRRPPGTSVWTIANTYVRTDLPATLQVGPLAYAAAEKPDLDAAFDEVHFAPAASTSDCTSD